MSLLCRRTKTGRDKVQTVYSVVHIYTLLNEIKHICLIKRKKLLCNLIKKNIGRFTDIIRICCGFVITYNMIYELSIYFLTVQFKGLRWDKFVMPGSHRTAVTIFCAHVAFWVYGLESDTVRYIKTNYR